MNELKPCQVEALKNFQHDDAYFVTLRTRCPKYGHRAGVCLHRQYMSGAVYERAKNEMIRKLCEGCKDACP